MSQKVGSFMQWIRHGALGIVAELALMAVGGFVVIVAAVQWGPLAEVLALAAVGIAFVSWAATYVRGPPVSATGSMRLLVSAQSFIGIFFAVLILVIGIALADPVMDASNDILAHPNILSFPLVAVVTEFLPVIYVAGLFGLAGSVAFFSLRGSR
jgi:hypothetical protein